MKGRFLSPQQNESFATGRLSPLVTLHLFHTRDSLHDHILLCASSQQFISILHFYIFTQNFTQEHRPENNDNDLVARYQYSSSARIRTQRQSRLATD
jgi:hypothetical protein